MQVCPVMIYLFSLAVLTFAHFCLKFIFILLDGKLKLPIDWRLFIWIEFHPLTTNFPIAHCVSSPILSFQCSHWKMVWILLHYQLKHERGAPGIDINSTISLLFNSFLTAGAHFKLGSTRVHLFASLLLNNCIVLLALCWHNITLDNQSIGWADCCWYPLNPSKTSRICIIDRLILLAVAAAVGQQQLCAIVWDVKTLSVSVWCLTPQLLNSIFGVSAAIKC